LIFFLLQVLLTGFRSLPPLFENTPNAAQELTIASKIVVFFSLFVEDLRVVMQDLGFNNLWFLVIRLCFRRVVFIYLFIFIKCGGCFFRGCIWACCSFECEDWGSGGLWKGFLSVEALLHRCQVIFWLVSVFKESCVHA